MDFRFAAALRDMNIWVMNVVSIDAPDTLPIIYERGLFGIYHNWCESFSTYPRSYDLLHADHLFSKIKTKYVYILTSMNTYLLDFYVTCHYCQKSIEKPESYFMYLKLKA